MLVENVLFPAYRNFRDDRILGLKAFGKHLIWFNLSDAENENERLVQFLKHLPSHPNSGFITNAEQIAKAQKKERSSREKKKGGSATPQQFVEFNNE